MDNVTINHGILDDIECAIQSLGIDNDAPQDGVNYRMLISNANKVADKVANIFGQTDEGKEWVRGYIISYLRRCAVSEYAEILDKEQEVRKDRAFVEKAMANLNNYALLATEVRNEAKG